MLLVMMLVMVKLMMKVIAGVVMMVEILELMVIGDGHCDGAGDDNTAT